MEITLGVRAEDVVSGFVGIVTGKAEYLTGCIQFSLQPGVDKNGDARDSQWFDVGRLSVIGEGVDLMPAISGGPQDNPPSKQ